LLARRPEKYLKIDEIQRKQAADKSIRYFMVRPPPKCSV